VLEGPQTHGADEHYHRREPLPEEDAMDDTTTGMLSDEDIHTVMPGTGTPLRAQDPDTDGVDKKDADGVDGDGTDGTDGDAKDADGTDTQDADGTDTHDTDGTDSPS
jgi:hypothetical protein